MKKILIPSIVSLFFLSNAANALGVSGEIGRHYSDVSVGMGDKTSGLGAKGEWIRSDHDGRLGSLGLGLNIPLGSTLATVGGKALYLDPKDGKDGAALAVGGGLQSKINNSVTLHGETYYAPERLTSGSKSYKEFGAGIRWNAIGPVNLDVGYRYIRMEGKNGHSSSKVAKGMYLGAGVEF